MLSVRGAPGSARAARAGDPGARCRRSRSPGVAPPDFEATVLPPAADGDVHERGPRRRGGGRPGDRAREARALRRLARLRHASSTRRSWRARSTAASRRASAARCSRRWCYDEQGQLLSGSLMDYAMPKAARHPADRDRAPRVPVAAQPARHQGHRRGRRDLTAGRARERGGGRAAPFGVRVTRTPLLPAVVRGARRPGR